MFPFFSFIKVSLMNLVTSATVFSPEINSGEMVLCYMMYITLSALEIVDTVHIDRHKKEKERNVLVISLVLQDCSSSCKQVLICGDKHKRELFLS